MIRHDAKNLFILLIAVFFLLVTSLNSFGATYDCYFYNDPGAIESVSGRLCFADYVVGSGLSDSYTYKTVWCEGALFGPNTNNDAAAVGADCDDIPNNGLKGCYRPCTSCQPYCDPGNGQLILQMDNGQEVINANTDWDLIVKESGAGEPFKLYVSDSYNGPWTAVNNGDDICTGADDTVKLNIPGADNKLYKYVKITANGNDKCGGGSNSQQNYGADISWIMARIVPSPCTDECTAGQTGCSSSIPSTQKWVCGNNDPDSCKEKIYTNCPGGQTCINGNCIGACIPAAETCNNVDDDCDGQIDEGFNVGQACTVGVGACQRTGQNVCKSDGTGTQCNIQPGTPGTETCNSIDDDCDGQIDEGVSQTITCGAGACQGTVVQTCSSGSWSPACTPGTPGTETCNSIDDDCDNIIDDENICCDFNSARWEVPNSCIGSSESIGAGANVSLVLESDSKCSSGHDTVGIYRPSDNTFRLRNSNSAGTADIPVFAYGIAGDIPITGDWNNDGVDTIGLYRPSDNTFYLRNSNSAGTADIPVFAYGIAGDIPITGDWNGDGVDTIGIRRDIRFMLRNSNSAGTADIQIFDFANSNDIPVAGNWDGDKMDLTTSAEIAIKEKDAMSFDDDVLNGPSPDKTWFNYNGVINVSWITEYQEDESGTNPEYYFKGAFLGALSSNDNEITSSAPNLKVKSCDRLVDEDCDDVNNEDDECIGTVECAEVNSRGCIPGPNDECMALWDCSGVQWGGCIDGKETRNIGDCIIWDVISDRPANCQCTFNGNENDFNNCGQFFMPPTERTCMKEEAFPAFTLSSLIITILILIGFYSIRLRRD